MKNKRWIVKLLALTLSLFPHFSSAQTQINRQGTASRGGYGLDSVMEASQRLSKNTLYPDLIDQLVKNRVNRSAKTERWLFLVDRSESFSINPESILRTVELISDWTAPLDWTV